MSGMIAPEPHWGRDNSDSLILGEQAKSLPASMREDGAINTRDADVEQQIRDATGLGSSEILGRLTDCERDGKTYLELYVNPGRARSHKAYRNEHFDKSKYLSPRYATRSKLFKPKTRNAVRKAQASAAAALFASADIVDVTPSDDSNPQQQASAAVNKELLNYRLDRANGRSAIPWFLVAMGAHQDAYIDGVCATKQFWKFREITEPHFDENGDPVYEQEETDELDEFGQPVMVPTDVQATRSVILADRPDSLNIAPENVIFDPNCEWTRPAQTSSYLIIRYPMPLHEVKQMMKPTGFAAEPAWIDVPEAELEKMAGNMGPQDAQLIRNARSGGADGNNQKPSGLNRMLWVYEVFMSFNGEDYCFWSLENQRLLSIPKPTRKAYPPFGGERPYVIGFGAIETHRPHPMAPVEALQQLQQEANDITNLRLDQMKQVVTPVTKIVRGRQIDLEQVFRRGQDTAIMVNQMEDIEFDRPPDVPPSAMAETNILNNDFDELAGTFSQGSVQSNRSLNETVGGMKLLANGANSLTEFDLRVWIETWVEPTLWQLVRLEQWYESDDKILALAGQKAQLYEKFGVDQITDDLLMQDCTIRVSAGLGAADPQAKLEKFAGASKIFMEMLGPFMQAGVAKVLPKFDEIADEVYGTAGYKNAAERFFEILPVDPNAPGPEEQAAQAAAEQEQQAAEAAAAQAEQERADALAREAAEREAAERQAQRDHELRMTQERAKQEKEVAEHLAKEKARQEQERYAHDLEQQRMASEERRHQRELEFKDQQAHKDRTHKLHEHLASTLANAEIEGERMKQDREQHEAKAGAEREKSEREFHAKRESDERDRQDRERKESEKKAETERKEREKAETEKKSKAESDGANKRVEKLVSEVSKLADAVAKMAAAEKHIIIKKGANGIEGATVRSK